MATSPSATPTPITPPRVAVLDPRTGLISREWYMFFLSLFRAAEGAVNADINGPTTTSLVASLNAAIDRVQQETQTLPVSVLEQVQPLLDALALELQSRSLSAEQTRPALDDLAQQIGTLPQAEQIRPALDDLAQQIGTLPRVDLVVSARSILPFAITVGASPYTFQNTNTYPADVIVNGGTVSAVAFSRDNVTFYTVGQINGMFALSPYDFLRVTYTLAPTMTLVPR
jgi:hypothetical protein